MKIYIFTTFFLAVDHIEKSARSVYNAASDCCHDNFFYRRNERETYTLIS